MKNLLFDDFRQWRVCLWSGVCKFLWGLLRIISCMLFGIISFLVWIGKQIEAFCKREFVASLIIGVIAVAFIVSFGITFVKERKARVDAEMQRDRLSYKLDSVKRLMPVSNHWMKSDEN